MGFLSYVKMLHGTSTWRLSTGQCTVIPQLTSNPTWMTMEIRTFHHTMRCLSRWTRNHDGHCFLPESAVQSILTFWWQIIVHQRQVQPTSVLSNCATGVSSFPKSTINRLLYRCSFATKSDTASKNDSQRYFYLAGL